MCANPLGFNLRRETLLLLTGIVVALLFGVTGIAVKQFHARERELGQKWYQKGEAMLARNDPASAVTDFRTALFHAEGNPLYELRLAQALVVLGHETEARTYLMRLWQRNPADGAVNLELARLAVRTGNAPDVINYYHNAIDGVWPAGSNINRFALRRDLCEYLIDHGQRSQALAELMALSSQTPNDSFLLTQVASLFLKSEDYDSALNEFLRSLRLNRHQPAAWAGAGKAAYLMGDYRAARRYLAYAVAYNPQNRESAQMEALASGVIEINPFDRRVPMVTRRRRAIVAFQAALARLKSCAAIRHDHPDVANPQTDPEKLYAVALKMKPQMTEASLRHNPDLLDSGMSLVFQMERAAASACGPPPILLDQALLLIAQRFGGAD
ncbi:MAG TPA: hypothetical protein VJV74_16735 [Terriglobia bacterium]|nr:hypothetical protein [Terriglobia bacterium]